MGAARACRGGHASASATTASAKRGSSIRRNGLKEWGTCGRSGGDRVSYWELLRGADYTFQQGGPSCRRSDVTQPWPAANLPWPVQKNGPPPISPGADPLGYFARSQLRRRVDAITPSSAVALTEAIRRAIAYLEESDRRDLQAAPLGAGCGGHRTDAHASKEGPARAIQRDRQWTCA